MDTIIQQYKPIIVQIKTPSGSGSGTGFYVQSENLIVTNHHVVADSGKAIVNNPDIAQYIGQVLFKAPDLDLAFIEAPKSTINHSISFGASPKQGEAIIAIGNPFGMQFTTTSGIVSKASWLFNNVKYMQIDAAINPGNSGGPLINEQGEVVGVTTFSIEGGENLGFALPSSYLIDAFKAYKPFYGQRVIQCNACTNLITHNEINNHECPYCGVELPFKFEENDYEPIGKAKLIETILTQLEKNAYLARSVPNMWEINEGSALVRIIYDAHNGFILGDAHLCRLPKTNIKAIYSYVLKENFALNGVKLSLFGQDIVLSFAINENYFTEETALGIFQNLFKKADYYDNILVEQFGAVWKIKPE